MNFIGEDHFFLFCNNFFREFSSSFFKILYNILNEWIWNGCSRRHTDIIYIFKKCFRDFIRRIDKYSWKICFLSNKSKFYRITWIFTSHNNKSINHGNELFHCFLPISRCVTYIWKTWQFYLRIHRLYIRNKFFCIIHAQSSLIEKSKLLIWFKTEFISFLLISYNINVF